MLNEILYMVLDFYGSYSMNNYGYRFNIVTIITMLSLYLMCCYNIYIVASLIMSFYMIYLFVEFNGGKLTDSKYIYICLLWLYSYPACAIVLFGSRNDLLENSIYNETLNNPFLIDKFVLLLSLATIAITIASVISDFIILKMFDSMRMEYKCFIEKSLPNVSTKILMCISLFVISYGLFTTDWGALKSGYYLGDGFTLVFGGFYIFNFCVLCLLINNDIRCTSSRWLYAILLFLYLFLFLLGIKQLVLWSILGVVFTKAILMEFKCSFIKINKIVLLFIAFSFLVIGGLVTNFRVERQFNIDGSIFNLGWMSYLWEVSFTDLGAFNSIEVVDKFGQDLFPFGSLPDAIVLLVPSFLYSGREALMQYNLFADLHNIEVVGTNHLIGEIYLTTANQLLYFFWFLCFSIFSIFICNFVIFNKIKRFIPLISSYVVFMLIYPIRGGMYSGFKIFISYALFSFVLIMLINAILFKLSIIKQRHE